MGADLLRSNVVPKGGKAWSYSRFPIPGSRAEPAFSLLRLQSADAPQVSVAKVLGPQIWLWRLTARSSSAKSGIEAHHVGHRSRILPVHSGYRLRVL